MSLPLPHIQKGSVLQIRKHVAQAVQWRRAKNRICHHIPPAVSGFHHIHKFLQRPGILLPDLVGGHKGRHRELRRQCHHGSIHASRLDDIVKNLFHQFLWNQLPHIHENPFLRQSLQVIHRNPNQFRAFPRRQFNQNLISEIFFVPCRGLDPDRTILVAQRVFRRYFSGLPTDIFTQISHANLIHSLPLFVGQGKYLKLSSRRLAGAKKQLPLRSRYQCHVRRIGVRQLLHGKKLLLSQISQTASHNTASADVVKHLR